MEKEDAAPTTPAPMLCSNVWPAVNSSFPLPFGGCAAEAARLEALIYIPVPEWLESKESSRAKGCRIFQPSSQKPRFFCVHSASVLGMFGVYFGVCFRFVLGLFKGGGYFWPFHKSEEKIKVIFVISAIMPQI